MGPARRVPDRGGGGSGVGGGVRRTRPGGPAILCLIARETARADRGAAAAAETPTPAARRRTIRHTRSRPTVAPVFVAETARGAITVIAARTPTAVSGEFTIHGLGPGPYGS